jgi:hypothetical protein
VQIGSDILSVSLQGFTSVSESNKSQFITVVGEQKEYLYGEHHARDQKKKRCVKRLNRYIKQTILMQSRVKYREGKVL